MNKYDYALVQDLLVYRATIGFGSAAYFAYNITQQQVYPLALPFAIPNTRCNYYTLGGTCSMCEDETVGGFVGVYKLNIGSLVGSRSDKFPGRANSLGAVCRRRDVLLNAMLSLFFLPDAAV